MTASTHAQPQISLPVGQRAATNTIAGTGTMVRLVLRRSWIRLLVWWFAIVGLFAYVEVYYHDIFNTQAALDDFAAVSNVPSIKALTGLAAAPATLGGAVWTKIWMTCVLLLAFGVAFLVTRSGRADEEAGRTELLRSRMLGLHAYSLASWLVTAVLCVAVGAGVAVVAAAGGLDPEGSGITGSLILGTSITGIGLVAIGVAAIAGQVTSTSRAANGLASVTFGAFYVLRMLGDLRDGRLTWASPVGWGEKMQPWGGDRWWPLVLMMALTAGMLALAARLEARRDLGAGLVPQRAGHASAPASYATPLGLAVRLQRGPIIGWTLTVVLSALLFGSVVDAMNTVMADASSTVAAILRGTGVAALLSLLLTMIAMITTAFAIQTTLILRGDEASGIIEPQLAGAVSRTGWALQRLLIPLVGSAALLLIGGGLMGLSYGATDGNGDQVLALALAALAYLPAVMVIVGIAVVLFGWLPRLSVAFSWGVLAAMWIVVLVGDALHLPGWMLNVLPFSGTPYQPLEPMSWTPVLLMTAAAGLLCWLGLAGFRRRDIQPG
jgi:ABC-2 type transport system permease protein